ncbi:unnamed protein product, partial [Closterium sp. NIES-54]
RVPVGFRCHRGRPVRAGGIPPATQHGPPSQPTQPCQPPLSADQGPIGIWGHRGHPVCAGGIPPAAQQVRLPVGAQRGPESERAADDAAATAAAATAAGGRGRERGGE